MDATLPWKREPRILKVVTELSKCEFKQQNNLRYYHTKRYFTNGAHNRRVCTRAKNDVADLLLKGC